ncbi:hypothetical protein [Halobaculum gomorrense]|uniref:Uncharacterized protein n=1 Tax=Halobaculum gomorrense TaxID=43928 RepID=A0A1M5MP60_9EURY|nr:hypothetical protein [Halobaculum gomorrense]SHG78543.1 hypothetical protein SAMN05443636_1068 [Halobaculum gomorrense]
MSRGDEDPDGTGYVEETLQGVPIVRGYRAPQYYTSDAEEMRTRFNVPTFDAEAFGQREGAAVSGVYPDMLLHVEDPAAEGVPSTVNSPKASLTMVEAPKGSGKSTLIDQWAAYQMEENDERIVRNGRQQSSDWRRVADWATIWLPEGVEVNGRWLEATDAAPPDPEEIARAVRYYEDVGDLVEQLQDYPRGTYNVVYPDPFFRGCEQALARADTTVKQPEFVPKSEPDPTPATHWWFGFLAERVLNGLRVDADGQRNWMTVHLDEFGMFAPESAPGGAEGHYTYECVKIMADIAKESRSAGCSLIGYTHNEEDVHNHWLKEFDYWAELANGERSNRTVKSEAPKPFRDIPMNHDLLSSRPRGYGLVYNGSRFSEFRWTDLGYPLGLPEFQFRLGVPESVTVSSEANGTMLTEQISVATDESGSPTLLQEYRAAGGAVHELRVLAPGSGVIDVSGERPEVIEALASPYEGAFPEQPVDETESAFHIVYERSDGVSLVAAKIPKAAALATNSEVPADD